MSNPIIGIDLGTTNSVVSILVNKLPQTILIDDNKLLPSAVSLTNDGFVVGQTAKNIAILEPDKTVLSIKRKMGQDITLILGDKSLRPEEISALVLKKIRKAAVDHLQLDEAAPLRAVITVPAYFTEEQRAATSQAAELANLKVERIINEPTAAALAYGMSSLEEAVYAIYDFGGGTFDISVIESNDGLVEVLASQGDNQLGGDDIDELLAHLIWDRFTTKNKLGKIKRSSKEDARLRRIAEQTKIKLSSETEVAVEESFFFKKDDLSYHLDLMVTRRELEDLIRPLLKKTVTLIETAIGEAKLKPADLDGVILVGGSSRIPMIGQLIHQQLGVEATLIDLPDEAVSHGATIQGAIINNDEFDTILVDITPHSLGIGVIDSTYYSRMYEKMRLDKDATLTDEEQDKELGTSILVRKNTPVPTKNKKKFSAVTEFQKGYEIKIFQGEQDRLGQNKLIGISHLEVKDPIEHGEIEVTFELDINGLLKIYAQETTTKEEVHAEFQSSKGKKMKKSQVEENNRFVIVADKADDVLLSRAQNLLENNGLSAEDKADLSDLIQQYTSHKEASQQKELKKAESELLDLLYYLEGDDH